MQGQRRWAAWLLATILLGLMAGAAVEAQRCVWVEGMCRSWHVRQNGS